MHTQNHYTIITTHSTPFPTSSIYQNGKCLKSEVPTKYLHPTLYQTKWNTFYSPLHNLVIVAPYGLSGGGNCSPTTNCQPRSSSSGHLKIPENITLNESTKDLSLNVNNGRASRDFIKDERKEGLLRRLVLQVANQIDSGTDFSHLIKEIEEFEFSVGIGFYEICVQILGLLGCEGLYEKNLWMFHREKLAGIAKRLLVFHIAFTDGITEPGAYEAARVALEKIWKVARSESGIPEVGFYVNLRCVEMLVEAIRKTIAKNNPLAGFLQKVIGDKQNCKESSRSVDAYLRNAVKFSRNLICDIVLLEFLGKHENKQGVVRNLMDMHCNLTWENSAMILDYVITCFKPIDCIQFLSEYLYFSSFEKDVWKVQSRVIELLAQVKGLYKEEFANLIEMVINEKKKVESVDKIKVQLRYLDIYIRSVHSFYSYNKCETGLDHFWFIPKQMIVTQKDENDDIWMLMGNFDSKVLLINGPAGSGKTNLALSYAQYARNRYKLVVFINCSSASCLHRSLLKFSKKAKLIEQGSLQETCEVVLTFLNMKTDKFLLVFDDVADVKDIKYLIPKKGHILVTSRYPIWDFRYELTYKKEKIDEYLLGCLKQENKFEMIRFCKSWREAKVLEMSEEYLKGDFECSGRDLEIFEVIFRMLDKLTSCGEFLMCLGCLRNFSITKNQLLMILFVVNPNGESLQLDLLLLYLVKSQLMYELKRNKYIVARDFFLFLRNRSNQHKPQLQSHLFTAFDVEWSFETIKNAELRLELSKLLSKHSINLSSPTSTSKMCIHKGFYHLYSTKNYQPAHKWFEICFNHLHSSSPLLPLCLFLIGKSNLHLNQIPESISRFTQILSTPQDPYSTHLIQAYLIKSYELQGQGIKIRDIIFHPSTNLSKIDVPEACYFTIHGICRLFLTEKSLKTLIAPFSSHLTGHNSSMLLIKTLLKLSHFFSIKERWTTVLGYVNLIAPILTIPHILQPRTLSSTLDTLILLLNQIKEKVSEHIGENHQVLYIVHLILAKIFATLQDNENRKSHLEDALAISKASGPSSLYVAEAQYELAKYYGIKLKNTDYGRSFLSQSEKTILFTAGEESILYARVIEMKGLFLLTEGNLVQAGENLTRSFTIKQKILENSPDNEEMSQIYASLGKLAKKSGNLPQALHYYSKSLEPNHKIYYSSIWAAKAYKIALELKQFKEALDFKSQQIRMLIHLYEPNSEVVFNEYQKAYSLAIEIKSYEQANTVALASLDILRRISATNQIDYTESMYLIKVADSFARMRKFDEAEAHLIEAVEVARKSYSDKEFANAKCALGVFYKEIKKYAKAIVEMSEVLELLDRTKKAKIFTDIGLCYMKKKCLDEAASAFFNSIKLYKEEGMKLEVGKTNILLSYLYKEDVSLTTKYLKKAIVIYNEVLGEEHKETVSLLSRLSSLRNQNVSSYI